MEFKYFRGNPFAVNLNKKEQRILNEEINKQILEKDAQYTNDIDACVLYTLHVFLGFGAKRLRQFWEAFRSEHSRLQKHYEMPGDTAWLASHVLKRIGVDVAAWNTEGEAAKHTMSYDIGFKAKLEGVNQWVYVGDEFIDLSSSAGTLVKEVCGSYPSQWTGKKCADMYSVFMQGASLLTANPQKYKRLESDSRWGTAEYVADTLLKIADNCDRFPTAVLEVVC